MSNKRSCKICNTHFRNRIITKFPESSIQRIHEFCFSCNHTNWHTSTYDFSVSPQVSFYIIKFLCPTGKQTKSSDYFIKNKQAIIFTGYLTHFSKKFLRSEISPTTLNGFHHYSSNFACPCANDIQGFLGSIIKNQHIFY